MQTTSVDLGSKDTRVERSYRRCLSDHYGLARLCRAVRAFCRPFEWSTDQRLHMVARPLSLHVDAGYGAETEDVGINTEVEAVATSDTHTHTHVAGC